MDTIAFATPADEIYALVANRARENPYEVSTVQPFATDCQGAEWACGWTIPVLKGCQRSAGPDRTLTAARASGPGIDRAMELVFQRNYDLLTKRQTVTSIAGRGYEDAGQQIVQV
jgi:hypothetical protein